MSNILRALQKAAAEHEQNDEYDQRRVYVEALQNDTRTWHWQPYVFTTLFLLLFFTLWLMRDGGGKQEERIPMQEQASSQNEQQKHEIVSVTLMDSPKAAAPLPEGLLPLPSASEVADTSHAAEAEPSPANHTERLVSMTAPERGVENTRTAEPRRRQGDPRITAVVAREDHAFVYIDNHKYHVGDRLPEGETIVRIQRDGVVLSRNGTEVFVSVY